jgi:hypothetical protein
MADIFFINGWRYKSHLSHLNLIYKVPDVRYISLCDAKSIYMHVISRPQSVRTPAYIFNTIICYFDFLLKTLSPEIRTPVLLHNKIVLLLIEAKQYLVQVTCRRNQHNFCKGIFTNLTSNKQRIP